MSNKIKIAILGLGHLFVDLLGLYLIHYMNHSFSFEYIAIYFVVYNLIAFALQPVIGYLADKYNLYYYCILLGLLLPMIAVNIPSVGVLAIMISTIGNAMYHVGGGVISVNLFPDKVAPTGVFVAPGAIGVFLGINLATIDSNYSLILSAIAFIVLAVIYFVFNRRLPENKYTKLNKNLVKISILVMVIVFVRGFIGYHLLLPWKSDLILGIILVIAIFLGKFFGGILADKFGLKKIAIFGLATSLPLLILGYGYPIIAIIGAMLFNLTMAITLYVIIYSCGKYKGFAFGLTTLALFISYLPSAFGLVFEYNIIYVIIYSLLVVIGIYLISMLINQFEEGKNV